MILDKISTPVKTSGGSMAAGFSIACNGKAFKVLSDTLYKNKIGSIVRELSCNAYDAHVVVGKKDVPFSIHIPDGCFLAYKRVRDDYRDVHSATVLNKPYDLFTAEDIVAIEQTQGKRNEVHVEVINNVTTVSMPRNLVNEDRDQTCSEGLHFCSYEYLQHFGGTRIVVLKINPADIVSIPSDYNNSKGRCSKYQVVDELYVENNLPVKEIPDGYVDDYVEGYDDDDDFTGGNDDWAGNNAVLEITPEYVRQRLSMGLTLSALARELNLSRRTIGRLCDKN